MYIYIRVCVCVCVCVYMVRLVSSDGKATRYGLDGPGIEFEWDASFSAAVQAWCGPPSAFHPTPTESFWLLKRPERAFTTHINLARRPKEES
jgi:hypothetical protein